MKKLLFPIICSDKTLLIGIGLIVAALVGVAVFLFGFFKTDFKFVHAEMLELASAIRSDYNMKPDYWGLNGTKVSESKNLPAKLRKNGKIFSSLGREILVGSDSQGSIVMPGGRTFALTISNISRNICIKLAETAIVATEDPGLERIVIDNSQNVREFSWSGEHSFSAMKEEANTVCKNRNNISWIFN